MATERVLVWQGISLLDGVTPIIVLATGVPKISTRARKAVAHMSSNVKTGNMIQTHILRADVSPTEALKQGLDRATCGTCPHVSVAAGGTGACYTHANIKRYWAQTSTWIAHTENGSAPFNLEQFRGHAIRFGAYGDPAAVPVSVWRDLASVASDWTGYTHQWRTADPAYGEFCMSSADSVDEWHEARTRGYRSFVVLPTGTDKPRGASLCPASKEAGFKTNCAACLKCSGTGNGRTGDVFIPAHGSSKRKFLPLAVVK